MGTSRAGLGIRIRAMPLPVYLRHVRSRMPLDGDHEALRLSRQGFAKQYGKAIVA